MRNEKIKRVKLEKSLKKQVTLNPNRTLSFVIFDIKTNLSNELKNEIIV